MASGHLPFDKPQKLEARHGSSSRTTPYFPHDACEIPSQSHTNTQKEFQLLHVKVLSGLGDGRTKYYPPLARPKTTRRPLYTDNLFLAISS